MKYVSDTFLTKPTRFWQTDAEIWRMGIDTSVRGPFLLACAAVAQMIAAGQGRIININITMNHARMRRRGFSPYGPSKAAPESETIIWAQNLQSASVTVNVLLPGRTRATEMIPDGLPEKARGGLSSHGRGSPASLARIGRRDWSAVRLPLARGLASGRGVQRSRHRNA